MPMQTTARDRLIDIMMKEQELFEKQVLSRNPKDKGGKKAFEYLIRQKIIQAVANVEGDAEVLLRTPKPLKSVYCDFKYYFDGYLFEFCDVYVRKAIENCVNNTLRKEFLRSKGWEIADEFDINDEGE